MRIALAVVTVLAGILVPTAARTQLPASQTILENPSVRVTTGIANRTWELDGKRLALLREALPGLARVAVLTNPKKPRHPENVARLLAAARTLELRAELFEATEPGAIEGAFAAIARARVGALLVLTDIQVLEPSRARIVALAERHRLPAMYPWPLYTEIGGLMSYSADLAALHQRSAAFVDRILKGAAPADLPVEEPAKFQFVVNMRTARALGLTFPRSVLVQADRLLE
jgi:putative ABC transport system substrate-binding protein